MASSSDPAPLLSSSMRAWLDAWLRGVLGYILLAACVAAAASLLTWSIADPSFSRAADGPTRNLLGPVGATFSDLALRLFGLAGVFMILPPTFWALQLITRRRLACARLKLTLAASAVLLLASAASSLPRAPTWPLPFGLGGYLGDQALTSIRSLLMPTVGTGRVAATAGVLCFAGGMILLLASLGLSPRELIVIYRDRRVFRFHLIARSWRWLRDLYDRGSAPSPIRREPTLGMPSRPDTDRMTTWRAGPSFDRGAQLASGSGHFSHDDGLSFSAPAHDPEFDGMTERESYAMARRFAPDRDAAPGAEGSKFRLRRVPRFGSSRRPAAQSNAGPERAAQHSGGSTGCASDFARSQAARKGPARRKPIWPGSVPAPTGTGTLPADRYLERRAAGDELYGRAVAIVYADRKATIEYLQQRLGIGYMRAADLIERMQQEGILGAPVRNGIRPILGRVPRSRVV